MKPAHYIASISGIGYIRGGGTIAAAITAIGWYLLMPEHAGIQLLLTIFVCLIGVWVSDETALSWGKDSNRVVIDEVFGMMITLLLLPLSVPVVIGGFVLFRFFDIVKPLGIRRAEQIPGGWGVMADDLLAGVCANLVMQLIVFLLA